MRSCEYSEASGSRRTETVRIGDIEFRVGGETIHSTDAQVLGKADTVSVTYKTQKNRDKGVTVTQHRTNAESTSGLCPVRALAGVLARMPAYTTDTPEWKETRERPMNLVTVGKTKRATLTTSKQVLRHLRAAAVQYGEDRLGFAASRLGTHSLRAGAAMAMFLAGVPAETIQLIGRWRSQTFLRCIRIQVQQLTRGVATDMTANPDFYTIERWMNDTDGKRKWQPGKYRKGISLRGEKT